jgi:hypothetical protein
MGPGSAEQRKGRCTASGTRGAKKALDQAGAFAFSFLQESEDQLFKNQKISA